MRNRIVYAAYGVLATLLGVAAGHLVAAFTDPASSPVLAVGSTVIDLTPTPLKEYAVKNFGTELRGNGPAERDHWFLRRRFFQEVFAGL